MTTAQLGLTRTTAFAIACVLTSFALSARADFTWDGGAADDLWQSDDNWVGDDAPPFDLDEMLLIFGPTGGAQSPDIGPDKYTNVGGIRFTGADASLRLTGDGDLTFVDQASIINDSLFTQTIDVNIIATGAELIIDAMTADFEFAGAFDISHSQGVRLTVRGDNDTLISGVISGGGGSLLKQGAGALTLSGENTFNQGVELNEGTIILADNAALGAGTLTVTGDSAIESDADARRLTNLVVLEEDVELTFTGANDLTTTRNISGAGSLLVNADAADVVLTLDGRSTYTGGTTLRRGIIEFGAIRPIGLGQLTVRGVDGDASIRSADAQLLVNNSIDLRSGRNLNVLGTQQFTLAGVIEGAGSLTVNMQNAGVRLVLSGTNTYEGDTFLQRGTITLGNDSAFGMGDLRLLGDGTLRSLSNFRTIDNRIRLGSNELRIRGDFGLTLNGKINGAGGIDISFANETSRLVLTAENTYTGLTAVRKGILQLDGSIAGDAEIGEDGSIIGDGTIGGDLTVLEGGELAPGPTIATLKVEGNFELETDGTYIVQIDTVEGDADMLDVDGTAVLRDGSMIEASVSGTTFAASGDLFNIIRADGGITDEGVDITTDSATLTFTLIRDEDFMDGDTIFALQVFRDDDAYSNAADPGNNFNIGLSLDSLLPIAGADPDGDAAELLGLLDSLDSDGFNTALNEISPESYNTEVLLSAESAKLYNNQLSRYLSTRRSGIAAWQELARAAMPRPGSLAMAGNDPSILAAAIAQIENADVDDVNGDWNGEDDDRVQSYSVFGQFHGTFIDLDTDGNRTGFDGTIFGGQAGIDWQVGDNTIFGVAAGYSYGDADWENSRGSLQDHALRAGPYLSFTSGPWFLDLSATFGYHFYEADRDHPTLSRNVTAEYDGWDITGYAGGGYEWELRNNVFLTPNASIQYSYFNFDGFTEEDGGGANLEVDSRDADSLRSRIGAELSCKLDVGPIILPSVYGGWEREWADDTDDIEAGFATGGSPFAVDTGSRQGDAFYLGFGINVLFHRDVAGFLRFEKLFGDDTEGAGVAGGLTFKF